MDISREQIEQKRVDGAEGELSLLLFSVTNNQYNETFGLNLFKVNEVINHEYITKIPNSRPGVLGMVSIRGEIMLVYDLRFVLFGETTKIDENNHFIITEYGSYKQILLVSNIDKILYSNWKDIIPLQDMGVHDNKKIVGVIRMNDDKLISLLDLEGILSDYLDVGSMPEANYVADPHKMVVFVDDSSFTRKQLSQGFDKYGINYKAMDKGDTVVGYLKGLSQEERGKIGVILTDIEMPHMDGYELTKIIKEELKIKEIPIVMYSSLSCPENERRAYSMGVNQYIKKYDMQKLMDTLKHYISH